MSEVLAAIDEASPSPDEDNSRMEQLMISMLEVSVIILYYIIVVSYYKLYMILAGNFEWL